MSETPVGVGTTTLDYLRVRHAWLGELIDQADMTIKLQADEIKRLLAENEILRADASPETIAALSCQEP